MPRRDRQAFIWVPRNQTTAYIIKIGGTDYTTEVLGGGNIEFSKNLCPDVGSFKFNLENSTGQFSDLFSGGETVQIYLDFASATTKRFEGVLERVENVQDDSGYVLKCEGTHLTGKLLDITVTESYSGNTLVHNILKDIIDKYLSGQGFTDANVSSFSELPTIQWQNKPFWDCVADLCTIAEADCYVDDNKDFHFFAKNSITTTTEAAVWNDTLISIEGIGSDTVEVRNKVIVYGKDDDGNVIIYTASDSSSQTTYGIKEKIIRDEDIKTYAQAKERGDAELALLKEKENSGKVTSWILPSLQPGEKFYVISPLQKIHLAYRGVQVTHKLPDEITEVDIEKTKSLPKLFKDRIKKEMALEAVENINKMDYSYNFPFSDYSNIDTGASTSNIRVADGFLSLSSGTTGTMISNARETDFDITLVEIRTKGEAYSDAVFYVRANDGDAWQTISLNTPASLDVSGNRLALKVSINSASTRIDSITVMYR